MVHSVSLETSATGGVRQRQVVRVLGTAACFMAMVMQAVALAIRDMVSRCVVSKINSNIITMKKIIYLLSFTFLILQSCSSDSSNNNSNGDNNSSAYTFSQGEIITDIDGNSYPTIVTNCSNQTWMQKNLNVSHYRNGDIIPQVTNGSQWASLTTGAWCYYANTSSNGTTYGKLYNWYAVNDPRGLAPSGWHVPTVTEWTNITNCLGGGSVAGGSMKETGSTHLNSPNIGATNSSGFTALPGGYRDGNGFSSNITYNGYWWSSTEFNTTNPWCFNLNWGNSYSGNINNYIKTYGFSVRCVKD